MATEGKYAFVSLSTFSDASLIAGMTKYADALVMVRAEGSAILTVLKMTKAHHVGPVTSNTIP